MEVMQLLSNTAANQATTFIITNAKLYVPTVTLTTNRNAKLLQKLQSGFWGTSNWDKCQSKVSTKRQNQCLD